MIGPSGYVMGGLGAVIFALGGALYLTGNAYLRQRDDNVEMRHAQEITRITQEKIAEKQAELKLLRDEYDGKISKTEKDHQEILNDVTLQLVTARADALQKPIAFGDDLIRDFILVDCLWALGKAGNSLQGRDTCRSEAALADPASAGISFSVLTPTFLQRWGEACDDWPRVGTGAEDLAYDREDWNAEYGNFDPQLCYDSVVGMTPEAAIFFRKFVENGRNYSSRLINYALEQRDIIEQLTTPKDTPGN